MQCSRALISSIGATATGVSSLWQCMSGVCGLPTVAGWHAQRNMTHACELLWSVQIGSTSCIEATATEDMHSCAINPDDRATSIEIKK